MDKRQIFRRTLIAFSVLALMMLCSPSGSPISSSGISSADEGEAGADSVPAGPDVASVESKPQDQGASPADVSGAPAAEPAETSQENTAPQESGQSDSATASQAEDAQAAVEEVQTDSGNVTVNFKGADIRTVFAYISEASGVDIVPAPDVKGTVDLKLTNKPWKTALDIIVRNYGLAYERDGDIIRVLTADRLKQEELTTQAFSLNYAKCKDVVTSVKDIISDRGKVVYDERTNTIVVTEVPTNVYSIGKIIERLDKSTPQVLIEARVIETRLTDEEKLGVDWSLKFTVSGAARPTTFPFDSWKTPFASKQNEGRQFFPQVNAAAASSVTQTTGSVSTNTTTGTGEFPSTGDGNAYGFPYATTDAFKFGTLDFTEFKAVLELLKQRADTDTISNPRIATLNNMEALINVGQTFNMPKYERNSTTGKMEITGYDAKDVGVILRVTPHINDNSEIAIDLAPEISTFVRYDTLDRASGVVAPVFSIRQAKTQVMIKDGDTIFIGGLISEQDVRDDKKFPFLGDLFGDVPGLGLLFTKKDTKKEKVELIFFITVNLMVPDKEIDNAPKASKAHAPKFSLTQQGTYAPKKKLKR